MATDPFSLVFGNPKAAFNDVFGPKEPEPEETMDIGKAFGMEPSKKPVPDLFKPAPSIEESLAIPELTEGQKKINMRRAERQAAADIEARTIRPDGTFDYYKEIAKRGVQSFGSGINSSLAIVFDALGANELAEGQRRRAANRQSRANVIIEGETTGDEVWENPTAKNVANFMIEQGVQSVPEMLGAIASIPLYVTSLAGRMAETRAENDLRPGEAGLGDLVASVPASVLSAYLDRLPLQAIFERQLGKTAVTRILSGAGIEGLTEFAQSGIEYVGGSLGTETGTNAQEALKQMVLGAVAGSGMGGALSATVEGGAAVGTGVGKFRERAAFDQMFGQPQGPDADQAARDALDPSGYDTGENRPSVPLTPEDRASPLPDAAIQAGKNVIADALGEPREQSANPITRPPKTPAEPVKFAMPVSGRVTSPFGERDAPKAGASTNHGGVDIAVPVGTPVRAPAGGTVVAVGEGGKRGKWVEIDHGGGYVSRYFHLNGQAVAKGDRVETGTVLGASGATGNVTGPHLHWSVLKDGVAVDPMTARIAAGEAVQDVAASSDAPAVAEEAKPRQSAEAFVKEVLGEDIFEPSVGQRVDVTQAGQTVPGTVEEVWERDGRKGVRIAQDDGAVFDEALDDVREFGARITAPVTQVESEPAPAAAEPASDSIRVEEPATRPGAAASAEAGTRYKDDRSFYRLHDQFVGGAAVARGERTEPFHPIANAKEQAAFDAGQEWQRAQLGEAPAEDTTNTVQTELEDTSKPAKFDAVALVPKLKEIVAKGSVPLGNIKKLADKLGVKPAQARQVMGVLAAQPNSGVTMTKKGQLRRAPVRKAPLSAMEFVRSIGGVQSGSHDLRNVGALARYPGVINNKRGRPVDEIGRALHEAGYFVGRDASNPDHRPTEAETLEFLTNASLKRAYTADVAPPEPTDDEQLAQMEAALEEIIAEAGINFTDEELADAVRYLESGLTPQAAVEAAADDAAARVLEIGAEETGNDLYAEIKDSIYEGEEPEQRDGGAEEAVAGPESVEGDAEGSDTPDAQSARPPEAAVASTAPEHAAVGVDTRELSEIVTEFNEAQAAMGSGDELITHIFDAPKKSDIVRLNEKSRVYHKDHGWMTPAEAKAKIAEWEAHAVAQGNDPATRSVNADKVVLSFFDLSGEWSLPWEQAGYEVWRFDIQADPDMGDVNNFSTEFFNDWFGSFEGRDVYAILAACPCTDFASSGARHFAAKDADGRTVASVKLVHQTLAAIEYFKPAVWALENPVGRIEKLGGLPPWRLSFDPNDLGDTYTKKTLLWGRFNADLPVAPVEPTEGSKMWSQYGGKSLATKNARSVTPTGFSYGFFMANNAADHPAMAIANKFDRLDGELIERAVAAGITEAQITEAVEDFYYQELDDESANAAIQALIDGEPEPAAEPAAEPTPEEIMGPRSTDVRDTLQRKADEPLKPAVEQKAVGSDGGLFDVQDTTGDLFAGPAAAPAEEPVEASTTPDPIERVVGALQGAIDALKPQPMLQDAGEKIGGARKDLWASRGLSLDDLEGMSQGEAFQYVTKDQVWPKPDYAAMVAGGATPETAAAVKLLRDSLAAKPRRDSDEARRDYIEAMQAARAAIGDPKTMDDLREVQTRLQDNLGVTTGFAYDREQQREPRRKLFSIFKGNTARFNTGSMQRKIRQLVEAGFPEKVAPWTRRFNVRPSYVRDDDSWYVTDKNRRVLADKLPSREAAEAKAAELYEGLTRNDDGTKKAPDRPRLDRLQRTGVDVRGGRDISADDFINEFRFRGVEFGNWVASDERQKSVNLAYEGLHDLASTLGVPPETLSLGGQLGLAFGARGSGKAAAHYEPGKLVINLTKTSGAGTLAHEWGHALDNYFGLLDSDAGTRGAPTYASGGRDTYNFKALGNLRPELAAAFDRLMDAIFKRDKTRAEMVRDIEQRIERVKNGIERQKERLAQAPRGNHPSNRKFIRESEEWIAMNERNLLRMGERLADLRDEAKPVTPQKVDSSFYEEAKKLSGKSGAKGYWARPTELFARTFESYVFDRIEDAGNVSQYLVQGVEPDRYASAMFAGNPYPTGAERDRINAAYDDLFATIKTRPLPATDTRPEVDVLFQVSSKGDPFYSALERAVSTTQTKRANAAQWKATLNNASGVKREELEWSGVLDWLDAQEGQIDKESVLALVRDGGIKVDEVMLGGPIEERLENGGDGPFWVDEETDEETGVTTYAVRDSRYENGFVERYDDEELAEDHARQWNDEMVAEATKAKFADWSSDRNNESYRELLITLPIGQGGNPDRAPATHWDQPAVVAHARFMDKRDADGNHILFVEEVQSDWHQKGRDQGYDQGGASDADIQVLLKAADDAQDAREAAHERLNELKAARPENVEGYTDTPEYVAAYEEVQRASLAYNEARQAYLNAADIERRGIPDAPFKATWPALVMKRLIRYAAEGGYDRIAWTTGEEQAARYDLAETVGSIATHEAVKDGESGEVRVFHFGGRGITDILLANRLVEGTWSTDPQAAVMTREQAVTALGEVGGRAFDAGRGRPPQDPALVTATDLRIGGEGMKAFYDRNLVNITNDIIKRYGTRVGSVDFGEADGTVTTPGERHGFEITDKMREAALAGQPLFRRGGSEVSITPAQEAAISAELKKQFDRLGISDRISLQAATGLWMARDDVAGQYHYSRHLIRIALENSDDPSHTLAHESIHAMRHLGLFTPSEWDHMTRKAWGDDKMRAWVQENYRELTLDQQKEEATAEYFADLYAQQRKDSFAERAVKRIRRFLTALADAVRRVFGADVPPRMFEAITSGQIGARPTGFGNTVRGQPVTVTRATAESINPGPIEPASPEFSNPDTEARWKEAKKGIGDGPGTIDKAREWWSDLTNGFTRHWRTLPNEPRFADVGQQFRKLESAPEAATEAAVSHLRDLVGDMTAAEYDLFSRKVVLDDLAWDAGEGRELPFGLTPATLREARINVDAQVGLSPKLIEAVRKRKAFNREIANAMVEAGVLTSEQIKNPAYFRHMVLDYARHEARAARGPGSKIKSPYWAKRMGSTLDINANLLEAELDWLQKAQIDIATAKTIEWVKKSDHNIRERLRTEAKDSNRAAIEAMIEADETVRAEDAKFRQMLGLGYQRVKEALESDSVDGIPPHLQRAASDLMNSQRDGEMPYALFAWMLDNNKPGAMGAGMVLKYGGLRKAWMRKQLGDKYLDPDDVAELVRRLKPEGYKAWQPVEGRHLITAKTISESALDMFVGKLSETTYPGVDKEELHKALTTIRPQLVVGGDRYTMVLPEEVADTLTEFGDRRAEGMVGSVFSGVQSAWKRWVLINPRRFLKYNINNVSGDLDAIIAGNPGTLRKLKAAWGELSKASQGQPSARYTEALERGVFQSGLSVQEIPDINRLSSLRHLSEDRGVVNKLTIGAVGKVWRALQDSTQFRESLFRLAAYLDYVEKIERGDEQLKIGYGASVPRMVDAVTDPRDRAALLARDLVGDYGSISVAGGWLRKYLVPFWSWTEINTRRYWRLTNNAFSQSVARGVATGGLLGVGVGARVLVSLGIRMGMVYGLLWLWNHLLFGDEEDDLGDLQKRQLHLILGRDADGEVITLRTQGALSDVLGMLGFPDAIKGFEAYQNGQGSIGQAIKDTLKAPVNRIATGTTPIFSVPLEQALGKELWPDIFDAREIKDRWRHLFETFSLEHEYDQVADKPTRGYLRSWTESLIYRRDPGEMAYDSAKGIAYEWLENVKGQEGGGMTSPRSSALRDYRLALRYGDQESADEALLRYEAAGGTDKGLQTSIRRQHPLGPIAKKDRPDFLASLTDEQLDTFAEAEEWYNRIYLNIGSETPAN